MKKETEYRINKKLDEIEYKRKDGGWSILSYGQRIEFEGMKLTKFELYQFLNLEVREFREELTTEENLTNFIKCLKIQNGKWVLVKKWRKLYKNNLVAFPINVAGQKVSEAQLDYFYIYKKLETDVRYFDSNPKNKTPENLVVRKKSGQVDHKQFKEFVRYFKGSGKFVFKKDYRNYTTGDEFGKFQKSFGYLTGNFGGVQTTLQRWAYFWVHGQFPEKGIHIDHIDGDRANNSWSNLNPVTVSENLRRSKKTRSNTGHRNISKSKEGKFIFQMMNKGKINFYGSFDTLEEAVQKKNEVFKKGKEAA